jgi:membrane protease YdiL (CAAX protease family)
VVKISTSEPSRLSPKRFPADAFVWWQSLLLFFTLLLAQLVPPAIVIAFMMVLKLATLHDVYVISWPLVIAQLTVYVASIAILAGALPALARRPLSALGIRAPRWSDLAWGIGGAVSMLIAASVVAVVEESVFHLKADEVQVHLLRQAHGSLLAGFAFIACVGAPVFEELTFRGFVFNALLRYMPASVAVVVSAAVFGLAHFAPGNAGAIVPLIAGGAVLAFVYYRSGSLVASMVTHSLFNAFTVVAVASGHGG